MNTIEIIKIISKSVTQSLSIFVYDLQVTPLYMS